MNTFRKTPEINNVLLTGGDPLILGTPKLRWVLENLRNIDHVQIIRIGSKIPVFNPMRIYEDEELLALLKEHSTVNKRIYVMAHINHPREMTSQALRAIEALHEAGVIVVNQTPVLKGINDDPTVLGELLDKLSWAGVTPYYFFVNRPVAGNSSFVLPLEQVYRIVEEAKAKTSGLGKRVKLVMSHTSGKIEILAIENGKAYLTRTPSSRSRRLRAWNRHQDRDVLRGRALRPREGEGHDPGNRPIVGDPLDQIESGIVAGSSARRVEAPAQ